MDNNISKKLMDKTVNDLLEKLFAPCPKCGVEWAKKALQEGNGVCPECLEKPKKEIEEKKIEKSQRESQ